MALPAEALSDITPIIDRQHLRHMTLGDAALEREVLQLFDRQAAMLVERIRAAEPAAVSTLAHALKGSARGIGAWHVAQAAGAIERGDEAAGAYDASLNALTSAVAQVRVEIARILTG